MTCTALATYENGILRLHRALPLADHATVHVTVHAPLAVVAAVEAVQQNYGLLRWTGDAETLRRVAEDGGFDL